MISLYEHYQHLKMEKNVTSVYNVDENQTSDMENDKLDEILNDTTKSDFSMILFPVLWDVVKFLPLLLIAVGTVGNSLTAAVLFRSKSPKTSFTVYVGAIAVVDTANCYDFARIWMFLFLSVDVRNYSTFSCIFMTWISYFLPFLTSWLIIAMTMEVIVGERFPRVLKAISRFRSGIIIISILVFIAFLLNLHFLIRLELRTTGTITYCWTDLDEYVYFIEFYTVIIYFSLVCILPCIFIFLGMKNSIPAVCKSLMSDESTTQQNMERRQRDKLVLITLIGILYLIFCTPYLIVICLRLQVEDEVTLFVCICSLVNYSIKCFFYLLCDSSFRQDFNNMFCCFRRRENS